MLNVRNGGYFDNILPDTSDCNDKGYRKFLGVTIGDKSSTKGKCWLDGMAALLRLSQKKFSRCVIRLLPCPEVVGELNSAIWNLL